MAHLGSFDHLSIDAPIVFVVEREREREIRAAEGREKT
jgi:hypothetical protein